MNYRLTHQARQDLVDIWEYVATDDESGADRLLDTLKGYFVLLGGSPQAGRRREDLRSGCRGFPVGEYLIFYRIRKPGIQILRVVHGHRNLASLFPPQSHH